MPSWDELFKEKKNILEFPQTEVLKFVKRLESTYVKRPLSIWDLCCGAGRNSIAVNYIEAEDEFYKNNPFPYTKWNVLVTKHPIKT
jgi:hypothetical protein